ncbi:MAG TPA: ATP-binding protein [Polyangiaceae bacterium]|nr:ATP-binding protein [Polyangiaceae bacterium]
MTSSRPRRVWIVDDSPLDAERARRVLAGSFDVRVLQDGSAALECLSTHPPPDVMVLDWVMPGITGVEVCRFLRSGAYGNSPLGIILLTAHRAVEQIVEGLSAGANDYLSKPFEDAELEARVRSQIRARELLERATEAEDLNRRLLESAPDPMLAMDASGVLTFANTEACNVFEQPREALIGQPVARLIPILPALLSQPSNDRNRALPDVEIARRLYSPTVRLPLSSSSGVMISLRDVTDRRQKDARRLDFYSIIAHDLRSPLNAMSLRTELILNGMHGALPAGLTRDILKVKGSIQSLVLMINDFLEIARFESTPLLIEREAVDVSSLVDATMEGLAPLLESGSLSWKRQVSCDAECRVLGDSRRLSQVFANLIGNAIKFTPAQGTITTSISFEDGWVEVAVEDTGRGVPPEALPTLFDRYTRAPGQETIAGSGLGLMIVRDVVEAHGGSVSVTSTLGVGSRFGVKLPSVVSAGKVGVLE